MLIIFGGLPGTGKTTISRALAREIGAVHLRVDSIEQAILNSQQMTRPIDETGHLVAYALAADNLQTGQTVIADSANTLPVTREAWLAIAKRAHTSALEIEVTCSDTNEHRRRVETRMPDIPGLLLPTWQDVLAREYHPWSGAHLVLDTAINNIEQSVQIIREALHSWESS